MSLKVGKNLLSAHEHLKSQKIVQNSMTYRIPNGL